MQLQVISPRGHETMSGVYWSGVLTVDASPVLRFECLGDGGCLRFDWKPGINRTAIENELKKLAPEDTFEPIDTALGKLWDAAMLAPKPKKARKLTPIEQQARLLRVTPEQVARGMLRNAADIRKFTPAQLKRWGKTRVQADVIATAYETSARGVLGAA